MTQSWAARILGLVLALIGLALLIGGIWLAVLGGSIYYLLAGLGLVASGYLLFRGNSNGASKRCDRTTWKISPAAMYSLATLTIRS